MRGSRARARTLFIVNMRWAGGAGDDLMVGGLGSDQFVMSKGHDLIQDFDPLDGDLVLVEDPGLISINETDSGLMLTLEKTDNSLFLKGLTSDDVAGYAIFS